MHTCKCTNYKLFKLLEHTSTGLSRKYLHDLYGFIHILTIIIIIIVNILRGHRLRAGDFI